MSPEKSRSNLEKLLFCSAEFPVFFRTFAKIQRSFILDPQRISFNLVLKTSRYEFFLKKVWQYFLIFDCQVFLIDSILLQNAIYFSQKCLKQRPTGQSCAISRYSARLRYIAWTCLERVFFILTVWPSKIEMKKHALHASPGDVA